MFLAERDRLRYAKSEMSENGRSDGYLRGSVRFEDVDHYASSIAPVWELEIQQVSRAEGGGGCQFVTDGAALAYHEHYPATVALRGALSGGLIGFAITDRQGRRGRWQGGEHPDHGLAHADAAREIDVVMPGGTRNLVVVLRASAFREVFESLADRTVAEVFGKDRMFQQLAPGERERLRAAWWNLMARPPGEVSFGFALVEVLVAAMEQGRPVEPTDWPRVRCLFRRALEQMEGGAGSRLPPPGCWPKGSVSASGPCRSPSRPASESRRRGISATGV